jgi:hypothetical protein
MQNSQYFLAGNFWLFAGLLAFVGKKYERSEPDMVSLMGLGQWFSPDGYSVFVGLLFAISAVCLVLHCTARMRTNISN